MKVYVPFFIVSLCCIIVIKSLYSPLDDFVIKKNMYNYSKKSYSEINRRNLKLDGYYIFIDCNILSKKFKNNNISFYKRLNKCEYDLDMVNYLLQYYNEDDALLMLSKEFNYELINKDNAQKVFNFVSDKKFIGENLQRYLMFNGNKVVLNVNLNYDLEPYQNYNEVLEVNELTIINKYNKLANLNKLSYCIGYYVYSDDMCSSLKLFQQSLTNEGIDFSIEKVQSREDLFDEHATGLAVDLNYDYTYENLVESIAYKYGFILRYKESYRDILGDAENGHFRYVGKFSVEIYNSKLSLDEYKYNIN